MAMPTLYGPAYSTYARTARLVLEEKGVAYALKEVDILKGEGQQPAHLAKQPFGKVPAFVHDGFTVYETAAIARYIDEAFPGQPLQPEDPRLRARMNQVMGIVDSYGYGAIIGKIVIERVVAPMLGRPADEAAIHNAMPLAQKSVDALEALADGQGPFLLGAKLSLADLFLAPVFAYMSATPEAKTLLKAAPRLSRWWQGMSTRPSVAKTQPVLG